MPLSLDLHSNPPKHVCTIQIKSNIEFGSLDSDLSHRCRELPPCPVRLRPLPAAAGNKGQGRRGACDAVALLPSLALDLPPLSNLTRSRRTAAPPPYFCHLACAAADRRSTMSERKCEIFSLPRDLDFWSSKILFFPLMRTLNSVNRG